MLEPLFSVSLQLATLSHICTGHMSVLFLSRLDTYYSMVSVTEL
jgi:hypothetical protein